MTWVDEFVEMLYPVDSAKQNIELAYMRKKPHLPTSIFKYREFNDNSLKNLKENTVWLADPSTVNDPYDCHHWVDFSLMRNEILKEGKLDEILKNRLSPEKFSEVSNSIKTSLDPNAAMLDSVLDDYPPDKISMIKEALLGVTTAMFDDMSSSSSSKVKLGFKLCSFSARVDSPLMWAHYAKYHTGFCIEYDVNATEANPFAARFLYPVIYQDEPFNATSHMMSVGKKSFNNLRLNMAGLVKSPDWSYEEEWRLLFSNGVLEEAQPFTMPKPKTVYLGSHIDPKHQAEIIKICEEKSISVKKMKHAHNAFKMTPLTVEEADSKFFAQKASGDSQQPARK